MCGIVAVVSRPPSRPAPGVAEVLDPLDRAIEALGRPGAGLAQRAAAAADLLEPVDRLLRGVPGTLALVHHDDVTAAVTGRLDVLEARSADVDAHLEAGSLEGAALEEANAAAVRLRDVLWALRRDRLRTAHEVALLAGRDASDSAIAAFWSVQVVLSALDRLEVRGRDSAGVHLLVTGHGLDLDAPAVQALLVDRTQDVLFTSGSVRTPGGCLAFVYKAAAEIGELGDNTRALRSAIRADGLLHLALAAPTARVQVLAHTRWASVGIISEANAHPLNQEEDGGPAGPYVAAALNGDVDNHADLKAAEGLCIPAEITTDAKVIPALVSRRALSAPDLAEAFRRTVASFEGSVAIAAVSAADPEDLLLALRGSGQGLYVGFADDAFLVASEPYGVVEETATYLRMDGETPADPDQPSTTRGQVVVLRADAAGTLDGVVRRSYDGRTLPLGERELVRAEVTTRDIDRGTAPHFLLKEITEAPGSFRKTLRGRVRDDADGDTRVVLGDQALPAAVVERLARGAIRRVVVLGQGTAAVAGQACAAVLADLVAWDRLRVEATTATEFSGFGLPVDLHDTLVVAVSQSGTTTDTNRTVDLARSRGAAVIAIVNRRGSDLTDKSDGVLYTSDGRDVEMSVASTKAFYSQVAAGCLLAVAVADAVLGAEGAARRSALLQALRGLPDAMAEVVSRRPQVAAAAALAPAKRYWAVVGNGRNRIAAEEVRIKLSELCYKSIACDATEDKKHIDLSSEPLILVCAAGLSGSTADDVAKEVAIYRAHKATPVVVASEGEERFGAAVQVVHVPAVAPEFAFVLSSMAGHLFGYEAALAIDAQARPLREARAAIEEAVAQGAAGDVLAALQGSVAVPAQRFLDGLRSGAYDGHLEAATAVRVVSLLRYATGVLPLDVYQVEHGKVGTPEVVVEDLTLALTRAIEELTRPIDAIKHQAKTVTVGISRSDEGLLHAPLVQAVLAAGAPRDRLLYRVLKTLADLSPAVTTVLGSTRYRITGDPADPAATIEIVERAGLSRDIRSRVEDDPRLFGTKRRVADEREVTVVRGRSDGRPVLMVPELKGNEVTGLTLLHVQFPEALPAAVLRGVLGGYRGRYAALVDTVSESEPVFRDDLLETVPVADLLTLPVQQLAERWRP